METQTEEVVVLENEDEAAAAALASMTAGYNKQRHIEPESAPVVEPVVEGEAAPVVEGEAAPVVEPVVEAPTVDDTIKELKAKISELDGTPGSVRKIYGELGNIQRTLKQLQEQPKPASGTSNAEVLAAIASAEKVAVEYPELTGPLVAALKVLSKQQPMTVSSPTIDVESAVRDGIAKVHKTEAIEALKLAHPDYVTVRETPEYKEWLTAKDEAFRNTFTKTWNANIVSNGLTEFKTWREAKAQAAKAVKTTRLEAAITPKSDGPATGPSKLPDSAGLAAGYNRVRKSRYASR
jgi:hypothetical protein